MACYAVAIAVNLVFLKRFLPVKAEVLRHLPRPAASAAVMGAAAYGVFKLCYALCRHAMGIYLSNAFATLFAVLAGVAVYALVIIKMKGVSAEEIGELPYGRKMLAGLKRLRLL
jgi:stage V sporulation protein B